MVVLEVIVTESHHQKQSIMSQNQHFCQFKTLRDTECMHHLREETPIRFSPILGMYLCAQHEKFIIEDHINQFITARTLHQNVPSDAPYPVYNTFSANVTNRFINREHYEHIPSQLYINQCLYVYYVLNYTHEFSTRILFYIRNEYLYDLRIGSCQIGAKHNAEIRVKTLITPNIQSSNQSILDYMEQFIQDTQINITQFIVNIPEQRLTTGLQELRAQFEQETGRIQLGLPDIESDDDDTLQIIQNQDIVDVANGRISPQLEPIRNEEIVPVSAPNVSQQLEITTIHFCHICVSDEEQKGFKMSCCNRDNTICVDCVINHHILENTKYCSVLDVKDMSLFYKTQICFFCRNPNSVQNIINDNYCKQKFVDILQTHIQREFKEKEQTHLTQMRSRLGL